MSIFKKKETSDDRYKLQRILGTEYNDKSSVSDLHIAAHNRMVVKSVFDTLEITARITSLCIDKRAGEVIELLIRSLRSYGLFDNSVYFSNGSERSSPFYGAVAEYIGKLSKEIKDDHSSWILELVSEVASIMDRQFTLAHDYSKRNMKSVEAELVKNVDDYFEKLARLKDTILLFDISKKAR